MTYLELISSSMRLIGALASGETPNAEETADALRVFNDMLDAWNAERLSVYAISRQTFSLSVGTQTYTLGTGGAFNVARPAKIDRAGIVYGGEESPIDLLTEKQYAEREDKTETGIPIEVRDDGKYPLRTLTFYPSPSEACDVALYTWDALSEVTNTSATISLPPGYREALRYNLAVRLAPEFGQSANATVVSLAMQSKQRIQRMNTPLPSLKCDSALMEPYTADITRGY